MMVSLLSELLIFGDKKAEIDAHHKSDVFPHYRERIYLYFRLGCAFLMEISSGANPKVLLKEASETLKNKFPGIRGVSVKNLKRMIAYAAAYSGSGELLEMSLRIPWTHNSIILEKCPASDRKRWILKCIRQKISKRFLEVLIAGESVTGFCSDGCPEDFNESDSSDSCFMVVPENSSEKPAFIKQLENKIYEMENAGFSGKLTVCIIPGH